MRLVLAATLNLLLGSPFYAVCWISGYFLNFLCYLTAWVGGRQTQVPIWFSMDFGPTYGSMNTPWAWTYMGTEPEDRKLMPIVNGTNLRQLPLEDMHTEWPPALAFGRTTVGIVYNKRGDESFPLHFEGI